MLDLKNAVRIRTTILNHEYKNTDQGHENCRFIGRKPAEGTSARWLLTNPDILILDEPTRGIDVGAKYKLYHHAESGKRRESPLL